VTVAELVPYDPNWPSLFEAEADRLRAALGSLAVRIDHHGSTAVPGLAAKPVIDIQVSVGQLHPLAPYAMPLETLGYIHLPHPDDAFCPFFHRPSRWPHTHHVHVVQAGGAEERRTLAFRDYLRQHDDAAAEYAQLKRRLLAALNPRDDQAREAYAIGKTAFVERIVTAALAANPDAAQRIDDPAAGYKTHQVTDTT
jgi:GrpB-like predicted nucleotidyltransferase (UPF0157 family)